jgi:hypothetical protein
VASPAALECLRPVLEGALLALIERNTASHQIDILLQILGVTEEANLLMDARGKILFANARGEELLSLQTQRPQAQLANDGQPAPLHSLIVAEMTLLRESRERVRRQILTTGDGSRCGSRSWHSGPRIRRMLARGIDTDPHAGPERSANALPIHRSPAERRRCSRSCSTARRLRDR